jgi:hypothetical protein
MGRDQKSPCFHLPTLSVLYSIRGGCADELADIRARLRMHERPSGPELAALRSSRRAEVVDLKRDKKATRTRESNYEGSQTD